MRSDPFTRKNMAKARAKAAEGLEARKAKLPHGFTRYKKRGCRCDVCREAYSAYVAKRWARMSQAQRHALYLKNKDRLQAWSIQSYEQSLADAHRHGYEWTGPELELLSRSDLSARQLAAILGRTTYAVQFQRQKLRREEPRSIKLAGI
jgi:hypothetical protein